VSAGIPLTKAQLDSDMGQTAGLLRKVFARIELLQHCMLIHPDQDFINLGYSQAEVNQFKAAFNDGLTILQAATGLTTIPVATNLMANLDLLAGDLVQF